MPELPAEAMAHREEVKATWHSEEEETPLLASPLTLQPQLISGLAGPGRECMTSAEPGHWGIPARRLLGTPLLLRKIGFPEVFSTPI